MNFSNDAERLAALKHRIRVELADCSSRYRPHICQLKADKAGYARLEAELIRLVSEEPIPLATAIALLESELERAPEASLNPEADA